MRFRRPGLTADARLLVAGQGVRAAGYGFTSVLLGALLAARGYSHLQAGVVLTALIAGTALASLVVGRFGDRFGRRRCYAVFFAGIAVAGVVVAAGAPFWVLLVVALTGTLSTDVVDNGPATTLEQAMLAAEDAGTAAVYGWYNAAGAAAGALGALAVSLAGLGPHGASAGVRGWLFLILVPAGITGAVLAARLSPAVETHSARPPGLRSGGSVRTDVPGRGGAAAGPHHAVADGRAHPPGAGHGRRHAAGTDPAAAVTNAARYTVRPAGPLVAGAVQQAALGAPLLVAGAIKAGYDLALWGWARHLGLAARTLPHPSGAPAGTSAAASPGKTP